VRVFGCSPNILEANIPTTDNNPTEPRAWRRRDFNREFPCGESYRRKLEADGLIETINLGPKMNLVLTSPAEARERAAKFYGERREQPDDRIIQPAEGKRRARLASGRYAKRGQAAA
jgi:hypothetical protein